MIIRGSSIYDAAELYETYHDQIGQSLSRDRVAEIVRALAERYMQDGYSRPGLRIDDSLAAHGVLVIDIEEPRIIGVSIEGNPGPYRQRLERMSRALVSDAPVRPEAVRLTLRRMRALKGLTLSAATERSEARADGYTLRISTEFQAFSGGLRYTNRGAEEISPNFFIGQATANGLARGRTSAGLMFGAAARHERYRALGATLDSLVGENRIQLDTFRSFSDPREIPIDRDIQYRRERVRLRYVHTGSERAALPQTLSAGLRLEDLAIDHQGAMLRRERLRVLELGAQWRWGTNDSRQYAGSAQLVQGLTRLGSGLMARDLIDDARRADFRMLRFSLVRVSSFATHWSLRLDASGQHSPHQLPHNERFKIGGSRLGRGFALPIISGDQGIGAKMELRRRLPAAPAFLEAAHVYGLYDIGAAWRHDHGERTSAASAGGGIAVEGRRAAGHAELVRPLTHADRSGTKDFAVFLEVRLRL